MNDTLSNVIHALAAHGLQTMGHCAITPADALPLDQGALILVGPDEPRFWGIFSHSDFYADGAAHPLDRWSQATLDALAARFGGHAVYPFGGPPYFPFQSWAIRTGRAWASPIGFLVHDRAGLFASYRGALAVPWDMPPDTPGVKPCDACADTPCKTACPVGAFNKGYDVPICKGWLNSPQGTDCMTQGCAARRACPVGQGLRLPPQAAFHMGAFL
ncbi:ferredoxin [Yoonia sp.]|uniref:ferredoxin n=1 Tax=Yoonia sp. TaxID=2212373 RepID=UPI001A02A678|nr:ferredoxin [Yoonia sp.]MBE0414278.1 ferredoxin [Yoonia sp.]